MDFIYLACGGFIGAILRYLINISLPTHTFPMATFIINMIGSFLIGFVLVLSLEMFRATPQFRLFFAVGIMGAFTTFSTFTSETLILVQQQANLLALFYYLSSGIFGIVLVLLGSMSAQQVIVLVQRSQEREQ